MEACLSFLRMCSISTGFSCAYYELVKGHATKTLIIETLVHIEVGVRLTWTLML